MKRVKKFLSLVLVVVICCSYVAIPTQAASFTPRLSEPSTTSAYWIHTSYGGLNSCIIADGDSVLPNCVGYAWGRAYEILNKQPDLSRNNAGGWFDYNKNKYDNGDGGYPYSTDVSKPKLGAIACWSGHVAVVEEINGNQIVTSESSWGGKRFLTTTRNTTSAVLSEKGSVFHGYIYIMEDAGSHTHSYSSHYEGDHPHRAYKKCSCGDWYYTGENVILDTCKYCNWPEKPSFSSWKDAYLEIDTITFTWNATKNTSHYNIWLYTKNAQGEWTKYEHMTYVNSGVTKKLPADEYMCVLQSCNSDFFDGSTWLYEESDFYYFTVFEELEKPEFSDWKETYSESETIQFKWDTKNYATHYNIWLETKNAQGEWEKYEHVTYVNSGVTKKLPVGEYRCVLQICNSNFYEGSSWMYKESDYYYFSVVPAHSHTYTAEVTKEATHLAEGEMTYTCACNDSYTEVIAKIPEHTYTAEVTKEATHLAEGEMTYTCACNDSYTEVIAKILEHTYQASKITAPTCKEAGYTTYVCACGDSYKDDFVAEKGHTYNGQLCTSCGLKCSCNCHKSGFMGFIWKITIFFSKLFKTKKVCACGIAHY